MWYFAWILGLGFAVLLAILNALWLENADARNKAFNPKAQDDKAFRTQKSIAHSIMRLPPGRTVLTSIEFDDQSRAKRREVGHIGSDAHLSAKVKATHLELP